MFEEIFKRNCDAEPPDASCPTTTSIRAKVYMFKVHVYV